MKIARGIRGDRRVRVRDRELGLRSLESLPSFLLSAIGEVGNQFNHNSISQLAIERRSSRSTWAGPFAEYVDADVGEVEGYFGGEDDRLYIANQLNTLLTVNSIARANSGTGKQASGSSKISIVPLGW